MRLEGKTALVTGASSGIGRATALALARRGATVLLVARTAGRLEALAEEIRGAGGVAHVHPADVADHEAVGGLSAAIEAAHGVPDVIVNNAGAGRWLAVEETPPQEALQMMGAPYLAAFYVTRAFLPQMIARGSGRVVNVNSPAGLIGFPGAAGYSASRTALRVFDEVIGHELKGTGVGVTHVIAGETSSEYFENNPGSHERLPSIARIYRVLTPEEVATAIVRGIERERRHVSLPALLTLTLICFALAPWLVRALTVATGWRRPAGR